MGAGHACANQDANELHALVTSAGKFFSAGQQARLKQLGFHGNRGDSVRASSKRLGRCPLNWQHPKQYDIDQLRRAKAGDAEKALG